MQESKELWKSALDEDVEEYIVKSECKQDQGKPRLDLVPLEIVEAIGIVMTKAYEKFGQLNLLEVE